MGSKRASVGSPPSASPDASSCPPSPEEPLEPEEPLDPDEPLEPEEPLELEEPLEPDEPLEPEEPDDEPSASGVLSVDALQAATAARPPRPTTRRPNFSAAARGFLISKTYHKSARGTSGFVGERFAAQHASP